MQSINEQKLELRSKMRIALGQESIESRRFAGQSVIEHLASYIDGFPVHLKQYGIMFFASLKDEIDTGPLDEFLSNSNITRILPSLTAEKKLYPKALPNGLLIKDLHRDPVYDIPTPPIDAEIVPLEKINLIIVPGLAFDSYGRRLGRGKGYYDQLLHLRRQIDAQAVFIGIGLDCQLQSTVPSDLNDEPVDMVCFPSTGIIKI